MTDIVWLASYPRSGNTWLRFLLSGYFFGPSDTSIEVNRRIADIHRKPRVDWARAGTVMLKTHFQLRPGHPQFDRTAAFVFLLRNPRDVLLSNFSYLTMVGATGGMTLVDFARDFIANLGAEHWRLSGVGDWLSHGKYWLGQREAPGLLVHYEELREQPVETLEKIVRFLGEDPLLERLRAAIESAEISRLRAIEYREKSAGAPTIFAGESEDLGRGVRFINSGETRQSLRSIDPKLDAIFDRAFASGTGELEVLAQGLPGSWQRRFPIVPACE